jgi:hypothetical protein
VLPDGPKRFPDDFLSDAARSAAKTHIELPEAPIIFDNSPLFSGVYTADGKFSRTVKVPVEGKFLLYAHACGHRSTELPEKVVEISRTVAHYEQYLRDLRKEIYDSYYRRTLDTRTAARLTQLAFNRGELVPKGACAATLRRHSRWFPATIKLSNRKRFSNSTGIW